MGMEFQPEAILPTSFSGARPSKASNLTTECDPLIEGHTLILCGIGFRLIGPIRTSVESFDQLDRKIKNNKKRKAK